MTDYQTLTVTGHFSHDKFVRKFAVYSCFTMAILTLFRRLREQYNETEVAYDKDRFAAKTKNPNGGAISRTRRGRLNEISTTCPSIVVANFFTSFRTSLW